MNARELARALKVSEATVSRLASGHRQPSLDLMVRIKDVLKWKLDPQADALRAGTYGEVLTAKMGKAKDPTPREAVNGKDRVAGRTAVRDPQDADQGDTAA
jgi:transcriptional regulator with XRE-family HTH domain